MSVEDVRQASDSFYAALNRGINGDTSAMFDICSHAGDVTTMHPLGGRQVGWPEVRASWDMAAGAVSGGSVEVSDLRITMLGNDGSYTTGTEIASASIGGTPVTLSVRCTNVYRREGGAWKLVHHHVDLMPGMAAAFTNAVDVEANKALVQRFNEGIQQFFMDGDASGLDEICAPDFVHHGPGMPPDLEGFKQMGLMFRAAISDVDVVVEDIIAGGDRVVDRITVRGTHTGELMGTPPSGKRFELQEIHVARVAEGKIVERWTSIDMYGLLQQIGGIPGAPANV